MYRFTDHPIPVYRVVDTGVAVGSLVCVLIVMNLPEHSQLGPFLETRITLKNVLLLSALTLAWPPVFAAFGLYRFEELSTFAVELRRIVKACVLGSAFVVPIALTSSSGSFRFGSVMVFALTVAVGTISARAGARRVLKAATRLRHAHVIIAGTGPRALALHKRLTERTRLIVLGFVDTEIVEAPLGPLGPPFLGSIGDLETILVGRPIDAVHIGLPVKSCYGAIEQVITACERVGVESSYQADIFCRSLARPGLNAAGLAIALKVVADDYRLWAKRLIDVCGALFGLVALSPIMLAAAAAILWTSPGPIFFTQERFGRNRRRFTMYKFRTMAVNAEARQGELESQNEASGPVFKIRRDPRVTTVGRFLRRTSIDELPQLLNVLQGDMSLVGPRPLPIRDVSRFAEASLMRRFSVTPGLTCLWQITGRSDTGFERWIALDLEYIDRWSLALDFLILVKTIPAVMKGSGAA